MRHPCKDCRLTFRYEHDLQEHGRIGHVRSAEGPTWSDKDVDEPVIEEAPAKPLPVEVEQELIEEVIEEKAPEESTEKAEHNSEVNL